jgi:hypothetical protein
VAKYKFFVAGVQHHQLKSIIKDIEEGYDFDLVPEPDNKFDSNAVKIVTADIICGYVPKTFSSQVAASIESFGLDEHYCRVTKLNPDAKPWEMCEVEIGLIGEDEENSEEVEDDGYEREDEDFEDDED